MKHLTRIEPHTHFLTVSLPLSHTRTHTFTHCQSPVTYPEVYIFISMSPVPEFIGLLKSDALGAGGERTWGHDWKYCSGEKETKCHSSVKSHRVNMGPRHGNKVRTIHSRQKKKWALQLVTLATTLACAPDKFSASYSPPVWPEVVRLFKLPPLKKRCYSLLRVT